MGVNARINISQIVDSPSMNEHGEVIFNLIKNALGSGRKVEVSFEGIYALNSSFVNSAFIELLEHFTFEEIKQNVHFINSTRQINRTIINRFNDEGKKNNNLIYF